MPSEEILEEFAEWLSADYAPTSVRKLRADVQTMATWGPAPPESKRLGPRLQDFRWAWGRWDAFCVEKGRQNPLPEPKALERRPGRRNRKGGRLKPARSIPAEQWEALRTRIEADDSARGAVLDVLVSTGKRISDVLRVTETQLREAFNRKDGETVIEVKDGKAVILSILGAPRAWGRLYGYLAPEQTVADAVSSGSPAEAGSAAYQKVHRALQAHADAIGITDVHLHRTRRTVAVSLVREGASLEEVQRVLDHNRRATTERYVDEAMGDVAARALQRVNR